MSVKVLRTDLGVRYTHTFMDDLESFFWLLVWSVAGHLDPEQKAVSSKALETLHMLDNDHMPSIASFKTQILLDCSINEGSDMLDQLDSFQNNWATHDSVISIILAMGKYFFDEVYSSRGLTHAPSVVFPQIVKMISEELPLEPSE